MNIDRRALIATGVASAAVFGRQLTPSYAEEAQSTGGLNALNTNSTEVTQLLNEAKQAGVGPAGPIPAGGGLDPLALADIVTNALNQETPESDLLAKRVGVLLSALTTLNHEARDSPNVDEPIPAGRPTDYSDMKSFYTELCKSAVIQTNRRSEIMQIATKINQNKDRYLEVQQRSGVPWFVIGALHYREANLNFMGHLHNGDNLLMLTVHVPSDRPFQRPWTPPGESLRQIWTDSAVDALKELPKFPGAWTMQRTCWAMERYNGFGCYWHDIDTPYLWNYTNNYTKGGYSGDRHFDPNYVSKQAGLFTIMLGIKGIAGDLGAAFVLET